MTCDELVAEVAKLVGDTMPWHVSQSTQTILAGRAPIHSWQIHAGLPSGPGSYYASEKTPEDVLLKFKLQLPTRTETGDLS